MFCDDGVGFGALALDDGVPSRPCSGCRCQARLGFYGYGHHFPNVSYSKFRLFVQVKVKVQITKLQSV
jgi:hypothetical protein